MLHQWLSGQQQHELHARGLKTGGAFGVTDDAAVDTPRARAQYLAGERDRPVEIVGGGAVSEEPGANAAARFGALVVGEVSRQTWRVCEDQRELDAVRADAEALAVATQQFAVAYRALHARLHALQIAQFRAERPIGPTTPAHAKAWAREANARQNGGAA